MMKRTRRLLVSILVAVGVGCSGAPTTEPRDDDAEPIASGDEAPEPEPEASAHRVGDFVVYRYSGGFSARPVTLREEVTRVNGLRLTIHVRSTRGDEERHWVQVVTDTEENRQNNVVDRLYEVIDGEPQHLENEGNADILRLYGWTLPPCGPPVEPLDPEERTLSVTGADHTCSCERQQMQCADRPSTMTTCECAGFVWGHAFGEVLQQGTSEPFWHLEVVEHGRTEQPAD